MNSKNTDCNGKGNILGDWKSVDGADDWWIGEAGSNSHYMSGDYFSGCYLSVSAVYHNCFAANDANCRPSPGGYYMCGTKEY